MTVINIFELVECIISCGGLKLLCDIMFFKRIEIQRSEFKQ